MKKNYLYFILFYALSISCFAQEITFEYGEKVYIDGKEVLKYKVTSIDGFELYTLNGEAFLIYEFNNNQTVENIEDDYITIKFAIGKLTVNTTDINKVIVGLGLHADKNMKKLIAWLIKDKVLGLDGKIDANRVRVFYSKYNEMISGK